MAFIDVLKDDKLVLAVGGVMLFFGLGKYVDGKFNPLMLIVIGSLLILFRRQVVRWL